MPLATRFACIHQQQLDAPNVLFCRITSRLFDYFILDRTISSNGILAYKSLQGVKLEPDKFNV